MITPEGVIRFDLQFKSAPPLPWSELRELEAWRRILHQLGLIGRDPGRYGGAGFGNVSRRLGPADPNDLRFVVSGSQTGELPALSARHYTVVTHCDPTGNRVVAEGPIAPSSESLTHGMIYRLAPSARVVFHVHAPVIWRHAARLRLTATSPMAGYGTPEMAAEMARLLGEGSPGRCRIVVMGGHEDGVIAFAESAESAGCALLGVLARGLAI